MYYYHDLELLCWHQQPITFQQPDNVLSHMQHSRASHHICLEFLCLYLQPITVLQLDDVHNSKQHAAAYESLSLPDKCSSGRREQRLDGRNVDSARMVTQVVEGRIVSLW